MYDNGGRERGDSRGELGPVTASLRAGERATPAEAAARAAADSADMPAAR